jgi:exonuclease SbcC
MIKRLTRLEVEDFRVFRGPVSVPLDADVVLIYGPNGSGKTGLISALEFAVTGAVEDLRAFSDDYPRCLGHIRASGKPRSCLFFESIAGEPLYQSTPTNGWSDRDVKPANLSEADRRFFIERRYLSQRRLGRLFEIYQSSDKQQPEQPLIRFVRELLALDLLENLTIGLYEVGNITRMQKGSRLLAALKDEEASVPEQRTRLRQKRDELSGQLKESLDTIHAILSSTGDRTPNAPWTSAGLRTRIEAVESAEQSEKLSGTLQRLQQSQGELQSALGLLRAASGAAVQDLGSLQAGLVATETREKAIEPKLTLLLQKAEQVLRSVKVSVPQITPLPDISRRLDEVEEAAAKALARLDTEIGLANETTQEMISLDARAAGLEGAIREGGAPSAQKSQEQRRRAELLQGVLDHLTNDICPTCGRDYSELGSGTLKARITQELGALGLDIERLESAARRRSQLEAERDAVSRRIAAIKERAKQDQSSVEAIQASRDQLSSLMNALTGEADSRQDWRRQHQEETRIRAELRAVEVRVSQQDKSKSQISHLADELGIPKETRPADAQALAELVSNQLRTQIDELERRRGHRNELLATLARAERTARELEELDNTTKALNEREQRIQTALGRVDQYIEKARSLARAANSAKERLLREVFNETLNGLWGELFERLVKLETFVPRLSEPTARRGQIRAAIQAIAKGTERIDPFEQAGSVLSAANLNTAALSLFLSLHLVERPRHRVLVLDDPIQSMDDVHVGQLANLLRGIVREAGRQLILCVHERSLYEYLCLELGPTREADSLLAIELIRNAADDGSVIRSERHAWKQDLVTFGM